VTCSTFAEESDVLVSRASRDAALRDPSPAHTPRWSHRASKVAAATPNLAR
jgi:hypothetical protein